MLQPLLCRHVSHCVRRHGIQKWNRGSQQCSTVPEADAPVKKRTFKKMIGSYFRNLYGDYALAFREAVDDARTVPRKTFYYLSALGATFTLIYTNPSLRDFECSVSEAGADVSYVATPQRSPSSESHVQTLSRWLNEGRVRRLNLFVCSVLWLDNVDRSCDEYQARCRYNKPRWREITARSIDLGVAGRWWGLHRALKDYDVNELKWPKDSSVKPSLEYE